MMTLAKTLFPNKVTLTGTESQDLSRSFRAVTINPPHTALSHKTPGVQLKVPASASPWTQEQSGSDDLGPSRFPHLFPPVTLSPFLAFIRASWSWTGWVCTKRRVDRGRDTALSPCAVTISLPGDLLRFQSRFMSRTPSHCEMGFIDSIVQVGKLRLREANDSSNISALMNGTSGLQMPSPGLC